MYCKTSTRKVPFEYNIDATNNLITITSERNREFQYRIEALKDLYLWLRNDRNCNWVALGSINEQDTPLPDTVEFWSRISGPEEGCFGVTVNLRGRFASYIPAVLEQLGFVELEGKLIKNRVRAR